MKPVDYKCYDCNEVREILVPDDEPIPKYIMCFKCNEKAKRMFSATASIIHMGKCGNYKNGYTSSPVSIKKS